MANKQDSSIEPVEDINRFEFEYVTSAVSVLKGDGIALHVVNDSGASENARSVIYMNTGAGATVVSDTGSAVVTPSWMWGVGFTIPESGEYWVRIQVTSEFLLPKVAFERVSGGIWSPVVNYNPGDFAMFDLHPLRKRIW